MTSTYLNQAISDVTVTATAHQLASESYQRLSVAIRYPQAIGPALVMIVSFVGSIFGGGDNNNCYFYANEALSLLCLLTVAIDQYFGWSKQSVSHANIAAQYFQVRDRLTRLKRQQLVKAQSADTIQPAVEKIEESYMVLLHKHRRPPSTFQQKALTVMRSTQSLVDAIERRRLSESKSSRDNKSGASGAAAAATATAAGGPSGKSSQQSMHPLEQLQPNEPEHQHQHQQPKQQHEIIDVRP
jgi:hypothetical protein